MRPVVCLVFILAIIPTIAFGAEVRLGVVMDVPKNEDSLAFLDMLAGEMRKTLGASQELKLEESDILSTNWDYLNTLAHYRALASRCDVVLLLGAGAIQEVTSSGDFPRPTLGLGVFDPRIQGIPYEEIGVSGTTNFSYVLTSQDLAAELELFQRITPFKNLTLLFDRRFAPVFSESKDSVKAIEAELHASVNVVLLTDDIEASLLDIPESTDAVYLWAPYGMDQGDLKHVADHLLGRGLPSFAVNQDGVDAGLMGCIAADNGLDQILKKLAVMIDDVARGENLATMPVAINYREELYLNAGTLRTLAVSPPFELLFTANIVGPTPNKGTETHGVRDLIETALVENLNLRVSQLDVSLANQEHRTAKSQYLPSVDLKSSYSAVNKEQTSALVGQAEKTLSGSAQLQQLVFSESANANIRIQSYMLQAEEAAMDQVVLDVILEVFDGYFDVLRLKTNVAIQSENLAASRKSLELARVRVSLGASSRADRLRWESEVALAMQAVIESHLQLSVAKKSLDILLNNTLGEEYDIADEGIGGDLFQVLSQSFIASQLKGPREFRRLIGFMVEEAQRRNPSKRQLESTILATERQHKFNQRSFFVPTLSAGVSLNKVFDRAGAGSVPLNGASFNDDSWSAGLSLSLPLFDGNRRRINLQTTGLQKRQLEYQRGDLDQRLALAIQSAATDLLTASTNIRFSKVAAENTAKNFELIQDNYSQGTVSIVEVLDAQTAALQSKQGYAVSVYDYLTALMALENILGEYSLLATPEGDQAFEQRFEAYLAKQEGQR